VLTVNRNGLKAVACGVDWGFTNPGTIGVWVLDRDGRLILVHEVYQSGKLLEWWIERGRAIKEHFAPEVFVCDPSRPDAIEAFCRAGLYAVKADNDIRAGVAAVQARLQVAGDGLPRLMLAEGALEARDEALAAAHLPVCLEQEFDAYVYPKAADGKPIKEIPVDKDNHGADACRYICLWADARERVGGATMQSGGRSRASLPPRGERAAGDIRRPPRGV
jgi:hypothetical protein